MRHLALAVAGALLIAATGCGDRKNNETAGVLDTSATVMPPDVTAEPPAEARDFTFQDRSGFGESIRQQLAELDGQIQDLAAQAKSKGGAVSDRALARIRESRRVVGRDLARIDTATEATWEDVKARVNRSVENLAEAVEGAMPK